MARRDADHFADRGRRVQAYPVKREAEHRIGGVFGKQPQLLLALGQDHLGALAFRNVDIDADEANAFTRRINFGRGDHLDPMIAIVFVPKPELGAQLARILDGRGPLPRHARQVVRVDRRTPIRPHRLVFGESGERLPRGVDVRHAAVEISAEHAGRG